MGYRPIPDCKYHIKCKEIASSGLIIEDGLRCKHEKRTRNGFLGKIFNKYPFCHDEYYHRRCGFAERIELERPKRPPPPPSPIPNKEDKDGKI